MIKNDVVKLIMTVRIQSREEVDAAEAEMAQSHLSNVHYQHAEFNPELAPEELMAPSDAGEAAKQQPVVNTLPKVGRNDPCPCGSGKKYKQCHGKLA
jgi:preprotein translocase subunit SecA